jgi:hypothetical protein
MIEAANVADEREIRVVDGDGKIGLVFFRRCSGLRGRGWLRLRLSFVAGSGCAGILQFSRQGKKQKNRRQGGRAGKLRAA